MTKEEALLRNGIMGYELGGKSREAAVFNAMEEYKNQGIRKAFEAYVDWWIKTTGSGYSDQQKEALRKSMNDTIDQFLKEYENEN